MKRLIALMMAAFLLAATLVGCAPDAPTQEEPPKAEIPLVENGQSEYQIVISANANQQVKQLSKRLADEIKARTGAQLIRVTDDVSKYDASRKEILLGISVREESVNALSSLQTAQWQVLLQGEKLVVIASNDYCLEKALDAFLGECISFEGVNATLVTSEKKGEEDMISLVRDGTFTFELKYPVKADRNVTECAFDLQDRLGELLHCTVVCGKDSYAAKDGVPEILIGRTARADSEEIYRTLGINDILCNYKGGNIVIAAGLDTQVDLAAGMLLAHITQAVSGTYKGEICIARELIGGSLVNEWLSEVPMAEGGTLLGSDDIGDDTHILCWKDIERSEYEVYLATLAEEGFVAKQGYAYSIGENVYTLLCGEKADLFVSYLANEQTLRVYGEKANSALYPSPDQEAFVPVDGAAPTLWQLENDWKKGNAGMSYVIRVSDGSFVIIDGGFDSQTEVDHLYHFLKEKSDLEKPVISAWIITHGHLDHYGAFRGMTKSYLNQLTIKAFYYNTPYEGFDNDYQNAFVNDMKQWTDAKRYGKLHSGMRFYVADARFDVIYTHEDLYPSYSDNGNDTSLVLRMQLDGKTVMFLADINASASRVIEANYPATELKSDIVQYAHHGYEGATKLLYDMIQAPTILWPMNICGWDANGEPQKVFERWIDSTVPSATTEINSYMAFQADYVKKIYVSGAGTAEIVLKNYVPTGERLPDYKTIYNERANGQTDA